MKQKGIASFYKDFLTLGVGTFLYMLVGVIGTPVITRLVDPVDYGQMSMLTVYSNFGLMACGLGLDQTMLRYFYRDELRYQRKLVTVCCGVPLLAALVIGVLLLLTLEHGNLRLRLFDEASCTVLEDYTLDSYSSMPQVVQGENVLLLLSYDVPERSFLALVREDGQYVPSLRGTLPNKSHRWYEPAVAYRNGHLAFATLSPDEERPGLSMEVWIWEEGGEVFYGKFLRAAAWENSIYASTPLRLFWKVDEG